MWYFIVINFFWFLVRFSVIFLFVSLFIDFELFILICNFILFHIITGLFSILDDYIHQKKSKLYLFTFLKISFIEYLLFILDVLF